MVKQELNTMLKDLLKDLNQITIQVMTKNKVKKDSDLVKSIAWSVGKDGLQMEAAYYYPYVSGGRRRGVKKVPIMALVNWIKEYGIRPKPGQSINQLAYAIQTSIFKQGINPKNYDDKVLNATADLTEDEIANDLVVLVADEMVAAFKPVM